jgi:hypothetical protein
MIITLVFKKNANFFAENCQKSSKIVIITSTPGANPMTFDCTTTTPACSRLESGHRLINIRIPQGYKVNWEITAIPMYKIDFKCIDCVFT